MAIQQSTQIKRKQPIPSAISAVDLVPIFGDVVQVASGMASGDIFEVCPLPAGMVPVFVLFDHANLGTAYTAAVGIMSGDYLAGGARTCDASLIAAATCQAVGLKTSNVGAGTRIAPTTNDRSIGVVISGTLTSPVDAAAFRVTVLCRPAIEAV
jgi:hypothetical protein